MDTMGSAAMTDTKRSRMDISNAPTSAPGAPPQDGDGAAQGARTRADLLHMLAFIESLTTELDTGLSLGATNPFLNMAAHLMRQHLEGKPVTPSSLAAAAGVPYATAVRRVNDMIAAGLIDQRPKTRTGKSFSLHPSARLIDDWTQMSDRVRRLGERSFGGTSDRDTRDYYFGGSYMAGHSIQPPRVLHDPLTLPGGLRILVHGDPTFMVMDNLKRQFEQLIGCKISQRAFSIDRLHDEALRNAERRTSLYDIIAVDLPWIGEFAEKGVLLPLDEVLDTDRLDPGDFHPAGWNATHWRGRPYGVPSQTTPELLFYRRDLFAEAGMEPPTTTDAVLSAAREFHDPTAGRYGIAWNAARGTALGHQFMMIMAAFGQPVLDLPAIAGGFDTRHLHEGGHRPMLDSPGALQAAEYLMELMKYSPPDILSMSWYERVRPYAAGKTAMAYGYTLLVPYFEADPNSPAAATTGYLPHPAGPGGAAVAPVGGYAMGIPANLPPDRRADAAEALIAFTAPEAQKLYVQNGSRTWPRYSVGADPELRRLSQLFDAVDQMSWRDELQFWPRPPVPQIGRLIQICGHELHDMLRGITTPEQALRAAQAACENLMKSDE